MIPTVVGIGAWAHSTTSITPAFHASTALNDILYAHVYNQTGAVPAVTLNGGTWTQIGFSHGNAGGRGTMWWSRYNGTQTPPVFTTGAGVTIFGRIVTVRGAVESGSPINLEAGAAPTFAETTSLIPNAAFVTTSPECLILESISGELPDADGTNVYAQSANADLGSQTELSDDSTSQATGGSLAVYSGTRAVAGSIGSTTITHANFRVQYKRIAITPQTLSPTDLFRAGRVPVRIAAAAAGVVPIRAAAAGAGVVPIVTTTSTEAGVVPVRIAADEAGVVPTVETP